MQTLKTIALITLILPALTLHAQFSKGSTLLQGSFSIRSNNDIGSHTINLNNPNSANRNSGLNIGVAPGAGFFIKDNLEWSVNLSYDHSYSSTLATLFLSGTSSQVLENRTFTNQFGLSTGLRKYYQLNGKLYGGFYTGISAFKYWSKNNATIVSTNNGNFEPQKNTITSFSLNANLFVAYQFTEHLGCRVSIGNIGAGLSKSSHKDTPTVDFDLDMSSTLNPSFGFYYLFNGKKHD